MNRRQHRYILTLVVSSGSSWLCVLALLLAPHFAQSATRSPSPDFQEPPPKPDGPPSDVVESIRQTTDITPAPPPRPRGNEERVEYFHRYRKSLTFRTGSVYRSKTDNGKNMLTVIGIEYMFPDQNLTSLESGADLMSDGSGALHLAKRFETSRSRLRPYYTLGAGIRVVPSEQLVSFIKLSNYQLRAAAGLEDLLWRANSGRLEVESALSIDGLQAGVTIGYVWAW